MVRMSMRLYFRLIMDKCEGFDLFLSLKFSTLQENRFSPISITRSRRVEYFVFQTRGTTESLVTVETFLLPSIQTHSPLLRPFPGFSGWEGSLTSPLFRTYNVTTMSSVTFETFLLPSIQTHSPLLRPFPGFSGWEGSLTSPLFSPYSVTIKS